MKKRRFLYAILSSGVLAAMILGVLLTTIVFHPFTGASAAPSESNARQSVKVNSGITPMHPMWNMAARMQGNRVVLPCLASMALPRCYSPQQIRQAYGVQSLLNAGITGQGRIITVIDAFQDPTIRTDLHLFDRIFGLNDPQLNIIAPFGLTRFNPRDPIQTGFAGEIALDVEWAHALAPGAAIDLILANVRNESAQGQALALLQATSFAVQRDIGSVITQSFGVSEQCLGPAFIQQAHQIFQRAMLQKQTVLASAGDTGASVVQCSGRFITLAPGVNYPASDPLVTGVGGTTLIAGLNGTYMNETTWNEARQGAGATGGNFSGVFTRPTFQNNVVNSQARGVDDVSFDADPFTGVPIVTSSLKPGATLLIPVGGTSLGAPAWAGLTALFDQAAGNMRLGYLNTALYRIRLNPTAYAEAFHDIQAGNNTFVLRQGNKVFTVVRGFNAVIGWDPPTGLGTPNAMNLARLLPMFIQQANVVVQPMGTPRVTGTPANPHASPTPLVPTGTHY